jgi:hypothetical protein
MTCVLVLRSLKEITVNHVGTGTAAPCIGWRAIGLRVLPRRLQRRLPDSSRLVGERGLHRFRVVERWTDRLMCDGQRPEQIRPTSAQPISINGSHGVEGSLAVLAGDERVDNVQRQGDRAGEDQQAEGWP